MVTSEPVRSATGHDDQFALRPLSVCTGISKEIFVWVAGIEMRSVEMGAAAVGRVPQRS